MKEVLLIVIPVSITALVTYLIARRKSSGRISTSDASDLWAESQAIRKELREEVTALRNEVVKREERITILQKQLETCEGRNVKN